MISRSTTPPAEIACLLSDFSDEFEETGLSLPVVHRDNWSGNLEWGHHLTPKSSELHGAVNTLWATGSVRNEPANGPLGCSWTVDSLLSKCSFGPSLVTDNFVPFFTYEKGLKCVRSILLTVIPTTLIIDEDRLTQSRNEHEDYEMT